MRSKIFSRVPNLPDMEKKIPIYEENPSLEGFSLLAGKFALYAYVKQSDQSAYKRAVFDDDDNPSAISRRIAIWQVSKAKNVPVGKVLNYFDIYITPAGDGCHGEIWIREKEHLRCA